MLEEKEYATRGHRLMLEEKEYATKGHGVMLEEKEYTTEAAAECWKRRNTQQRPWCNARKVGIHNRGRGVMLEK